jgi:hypothetical protein
MRRIGLPVVLALSLALAPPLEAQPTKIPRLGYLVLPPLSETPSPERAAFLAGLRELGWIDGKTIAIEYRSANWNVELLNDLAEELVRMKVDIIVSAGGGAPLRAARQATSTIPIVMTGSSDPVAEGLVASMARPGGNVTGSSLMLAELGSKRLEYLSKQPSHRVWETLSTLSSSSARPSPPREASTTFFRQWRWDISEDLQRVVQEPEGETIVLQGHEGPPRR